MDPTCCDSVAPAGLTVQVCFPGARAAVLDNLNRQREEGRLCDLSIQVQGRVFRAHRCVLAASSPYFHDQVLLKNVTTVSLPSVMDPVAFESVLSSAYTGQLSIVHDDIVNYVTVASFLQMWHIVDKCTEILKRPRPSGEAAAAHPCSASRQQSPSSTESLYVEREGRRRDRKPDALPPLATWRRPQQLARWGRSRPSAAQHLADSQLDSLPSYEESDYTGCEEVWASCHVKTGLSAHDGPGHSNRHHGGVPGGEALKQKVRLQQRVAPQSADRLSDKTRESDETLDRRRAERIETEADEGVGEGVERREGFAHMRHADLLPVSSEQEEAGHAAGKQSVEVMREKAQRDVAGSDAPSDLSSAHGCGTGGTAPGPSCPASARPQWQTAPWSQQEGQGGHGNHGDKDEEEDFECFSGGTFNKDTYDEIEDGTGQVSQRQLASPDFSLTGSEVNWPSTSGPLGGSVTPTSSRHLSPSSAAFPPPPSPPTPSSSSSVSLAGASYSGKVHFCHCGKAYTLKSMRDRHVKMQHLNLRPFGCPVCTKSFKMKHHLTKHLKTHGGLRPYECSLCGKKVIWRDSFLRHQARCERLASSSGASARVAGVDGGYGYAFDEGEAFLPAGQVKVEQVDFHRDVEDGMGGLLDNVSGMVDELRTQSLNTACHVFKEEATEGFSGS
ncbi:zinc finger and BTB domain-containing protein 22 isoform 1-T2 [Odontesthes bonariensis]|uniref:zinc finger and BTB domain-containing protein 22 n=1 Tax=Odontesthes bonariensis TaxID=219752 RepID=UPI003F581A46